MAKDATQIKQKFAPKDEMMKCHRCNVPRHRDDWGKLTVIDYFAMDGTPRHERKRMVCKECIRADYPVEPRDPVTVKKRRRA